MHPRRVSPLPEGIGIKEYVQWDEHKNENPYLP